MPPLIIGEDAVIGSQRGGSNHYGRHAADAPSNVLTGTKVTSRYQVKAQTGTTRRPLCPHK